MMCGYDPTNDHLPIDRDTCCWTGQLERTRNWKVPSWKFGIIKKPNDRIVSVNF